MCKFNPKNDSRRIDPCMKNLIAGINGVMDMEIFQIMACCCGHGKYPMTIIVRGLDGFTFDLISAEEISRKKKFYKKDKKGYYYIPETLKE